MKHILLGLLSAASLGASAQISEAEYYLPKTEIHFQVMIEKASYTPGEFAVYSDRFLKKSARTQSATSYKIIGVDMYTTAIPDKDKLFTLPLDKKHTIFSVERDENGVIKAINAKAKPMAEVHKFVPAQKVHAPNPHDYMNEAILSVGSKAKMAEMTAKEIYDIRDSRNELTRGEAEYMPKDGEQLKIMLESLKQQEDILMQTFQGVTERDTIIQEVCFVPEAPTAAGAEGEQSAKAEKTLLFRFSQKLGLVEKDNLAGSPYYIYIEDKHIVPELKTDADGEKRDKKDPGIMVNMPGQITATIIQGIEPMKSFTFYAAQYGRLESLPSALFGKKMTSHVVLNPVTGNVESIETEPLE